MRKVTIWVVAMGIVVGLVAACGTPNEKDMKSKLSSEAQSLNTSNYQSTATMIVQMDNSSQTYHIETLYESPDVYAIKLGDSNKNINQIVVHNKNGMFIVSPQLQKVFRFNGNWAQNQGHIYLYDQILNQIVTGKDVKMTKNGKDYLFDMPVSPANDVVVRETVELASGTLSPKQVILYDKNNKAVVTIAFNTFKTGMKFTEEDFNPQNLTQAVKTTIAETPQQFGYIEPDVSATALLGDKLSIMDPSSNDSALLRYTGDKAFTLDEWRPMPGVSGLVNAQLLDMFGTPAVYSTGDHAGSLMWIQNGVEFSITSSKMSMDDMQKVAEATFGQVGK